MSVFFEEALHDVIGYFITKRHNKCLERRLIHSCGIPEPRLRHVKGVNTARFNVFALMHCVATKLLNNTT